MKKYILIVLLIALVLSCGCSKNGNNPSNSYDDVSNQVNSDQISKFTDLEVIEFLEKQGYLFSATGFNENSNTQYIYVSNTENEICFQKIINRFIGTHYYWKNDDINSEWADIKSNYENVKDEEKKQYDEYKKWLEFQGLTSKQLTDALDCYQILQSE